LLVSDCRCRLRADTGETAADGDQLPPGVAEGSRPWFTGLVIVIVIAVFAVPRTIRRKL